MTFQIIIRGEAEQELFQAMTFYEDREEGLGQKFGHDVEAIFETIAQTPDRFP
jgi:hypothetical protein